MIGQATVYEGEGVADLPQSVQLPTANVRHLVTDRFTIADARQVKEIAHQRPQEAATVDIVIVAQQLLREAQNALLKTLEEPPATTRIHIVVPAADSLLPTVLSRVQVQRREGVDQSQTENDVFPAFLQSSYKDRLASIDTHHKKKDNTFFLQLFAGAELYAAANRQSHPLLAQFVVDTQQLLQSPGASKKMLSEELALLLPYQS